MSVRRLAVLAATAAAVAAPVLAAPAATAAPATAAPAAARAVPADWCHSHPLMPWAMHGTNAVNIRSKATTHSTVLGVLYKSHGFTVHKKSGGWVYVTDKKTHVTGWVSGQYVYQDVRMCLPD
ncbi:SH3 domain-containing protein [Streptomyces noursei]|uniref:SH3 domain-containing protein n=1 Tax=Streptomyces noursei TaxID=1971 RepID=UPI0035E2D448